MLVHQGALLSAADSFGLAKKNDVLDRATRDNEFREEADAAKRGEDIQT